MKKRTKITLWSILFVIVVYRQCFNQSKFARFGTYEADAGQMGRYRRDDLQRLKL